MKRKIKKITLGYSVLASYRECPTKFRYGNLENLTKPHSLDLNKGSPLNFGTYVHEFMEFYHAGRPSDEVLDQVIGKASQSSLSVVEPSAPRSLLHLELLLQNYVKIFPDPNGEFKPYEHTDGKPAFEFEVEFVLSTNPLIVWRQRYDGLVQLPGGEVAILEHKTASGDLRKDLRDRMMPNAQAVGYVYGARRALGVPAIGVLFNGLCTYRPLVNPGYVSKSRGTPQPLFLRELVEVKEWQLDDWLTTTLRDVKRMIEDIEEDAFGSNAPAACTLFNSRCRFAELCKTSPAERQVVKDNVYEKDTYEGFKIEFKT